MKKALVTQAFGDEWKKILELTQPRMEAYCKRHKIDFIALEKPLVDPVKELLDKAIHLLCVKAEDDFYDC